jgi:multidrug transporter EmrE-like cation transporter
LTAFANGGFSTIGIIAGTLFVLATSASFQAIDYIGVALAQGIWGGIAMVVSYTWGTGIFHEVPSNEGLSIFALML